MILSINIPEAKAERLVNAFCNHFSYEADKKATETKKQFVKRQIIGLIKGIVITQEASEAERATRETFDDMDIT